MKRKIIKIDEEKCIGCTLCSKACKEGAIGMVNGKAKLLREDHCDGLGNCLPVCPTGAISFEEKELAPKLPCGCPGTMAKSLSRENAAAPEASKTAVPSHLSQWPVQLKLVPVNAPYFNNAHLLLAADCCAYAYGAFHEDFIKGKVALIGCPKLDDTDYSEKLEAILKNNEIKSITLARMEVPCCGGLEQMLKNALINSGKVIPWGIKIVTIDGNIQEE